MNLTKIIIVLVVFGAVALFAIPRFFDQQKRTRLTKEFEPALQRYGAVSFGGETKNGRLAWPHTAADLDPSELPTIPGDVFVMKRAVRIMSGTNWEDRPATIHDSFFELSDAVRAKSPADVKTLVYLTKHAVSKDYRSSGGSGAATRFINQIVLQLNIYDLEKKVYLGKWTLEGQKPPHSFDAMDTPDPAPPPSVAEFLEALPRR